MIYFAFAQLPTGTIKIGCSTNVKQRLAALRTEFGHAITLLRCIEGKFETERELHQRFAHLRVEGCGREQFRPDAELIAFVESLDDITRDDTTVKLDREVAAQVHYIAVKRRVPLAELLTEALRPVIAKLFEDLTREEGK